MLRILLILLLILGGSANGQQAENDYAAMAETMLEMMGTMAQVYSGGSRGAPPAWGAEPWASLPGGLPGGAMLPGDPLSYLSPPAPLDPIPALEGAGVWPQPPQPSPQSSAPPTQAPPRSPLDGTWLDSSGEVLLIRRGRFRIYLTPENYREGYLWRENQTLIMEDPATGRRMEYEYAQQDHKLALRDPQGNLLLYRRLVQPD